jgi:23S rRNA (guanosine2251-2'-O)-methyltransferase
MRPNSGPVFLVFMQNSQIYLALENIRSIYNVGSILRTCSFFGIKKVFLVGYSGKLKLPNGKYIISPKLNKTALGSQHDVDLINIDSSQELVNECKRNVWDLYALEQTAISKNLFDCKFTSNEHGVFVLGNEIEGVSEFILREADEILEIPRFGTHNSLNVSIAAAVLLTALTKN